MGEYQVNGMTIKKELSEMSLEELWELFPIFLVEHNEKWADHYNEMERTLREMLPAGAIDRISHIGSTAIQNIRALKNNLQAFWIREQKEETSNDYISADTKRDGETEISQRFFHD